MDDVSANALWTQMKTFEAQAKGLSVPELEAPDYASVFKMAVDKVNQAQQHGSAMAQAFEMGDEDVDLAGAMVSLQKANIYFQGITQVRNKLVSAYQEIMNMPI